MVEAEQKFISLLTCTTGHNTDMMSKINERYFKKPYLFCNIRQITKPENGFLQLVAVWQLIFIQALYVWQIKICPEF